jgi:hypothetical protein
MDCRVKPGNDEKTTATQAQGNRSPEAKQKLASAASCRAVQKKAPRERGFFLVLKPQYARQRP